VTSWTLGRYLLTRYTKTTFCFLLGIFSLVFLIDFTENSRRLATLQNYTIIKGLAISILHIPFVMQQIFPFIALFSAMATLISLNRRFELVVIRSIGISTWQFLLPICLGAFLFGLSVILIVNPLAAWGDAKSQNIIASWRSNSNYVTENNRVPWFTQRTSEGIIIIGAKTVFNPGHTLLDATFVRFNKNQSIHDWLNADTARIESGNWLLLNGIRHQLGQPPEKFDKIQIPTQIKIEFLEEYLSNPQTIPFYELPYKIQVAKSFGYPANEFDMYLHSIIALPAFLIAMTLIAATVSLKFVRFGQSNMTILNGIAVGFVFYVINVLVQAFGKAGYMPPILAAWIPTLIAIFFGVSFLLQREDG